MRLPRRAVLAAIVLIALLPAAALAEKLPIPPILSGERDTSGRTVLDLVAREGTRSFLPDTVTSTFGFNGDFLGPTIRLRRGEEVAIRVKNDLDEVTTVHWHGLHVPGEMDGGPHQTIEPGETWTPQFVINQEAATLWYHPHALGNTGQQVYRGLSGLFIIDDEHSRGLNIPQNYGVDDIPLVIQDRRFFSDGRFAYAQGQPDIMHGVIGNVMLVNGAVEPELDVQAGLVRFRILNGSDSSVYRLSLTDGTILRQIASDGGFLEAPIDLESIVLSPGERAEAIVDFSDFESGESLGLSVEIYGGGALQALRIRVGSEATNQSLEIPAVLNTIERIPESEATTTRRFVMQTMGPGGQLTINGKKMSMDRIDVRLPLGSTEIWEIQNQQMGMMNIPHSFHVHDVQFQVLSINGEDPPPELSGWKDTVLVWPGETMRFIARYEDYTGLFMYHCHLLVHEDAGMMGQFEVF